MGSEENKDPPKKENQNELKNQKKSQPKFATLVSPWTWKDKKSTPISAPSIHIGALVHASVTKKKCGISHT